MSGGIVFVCSNSETMDWMRRSGVSSMFTLMLALSGTLVLMGYMILVKSIGSRGPGYRNA